MPAWLTSDLLGLLAGGLFVTVALTALTAALAFLAGIGAGWLRVSASPLTRGLGALYVEVFRNVPALVGVIFWAYALPTAFPADLRRSLFFDNGLMAAMGALTGLSIPYYALAAAVGLTLNTSAYIAELFRAGVRAVPREHWEAARTLGASQGRAFWHVLLPHGLRVAWPALTTRFVHHLKNTSLASLVAVPELFKAMQTTISQSFFAVEMLLLTSVLYWGLSSAFAWGLRRWAPGPRRAV